MAKESITVKCYPSEEETNKTIKEYESFGWELANNQNCREYTSYFNQSLSSESYNVLTFSREKSEKWYNSVVDIETQYKKAAEELTALNNTKPKQPNVSGTGFLSFLLFICGGGIAVPGLVMLILSFVDTLEYYWSFIPLGISVVLLIVAIAVKYYEKKLVKAYEEQLQAWHGANDRCCEKLEEQKRDLAKQAIDVISGCAK